MKRFFSFVAVAVILCACAPQDQPTQLTLSEYSQIREGMTLTEIEQLIGKGQPIEPFYPDAPGQTPSTAYKWHNPDSTIMTAAFIDDRLVVKAQIGLK